MPISWNEIRHNAIRFAKDWSGASSEKSEKQTFWNEFFEVFGIHRRTVASFEVPVRGISGKYKFIDLFWKGRLLVEHKSRGEDLDKAKSQAFEYIQDLASEGRHDEIPRYVLLSDFERMCLYDLEPDDPGSQPLFGDFRVSTFEFLLRDLHKAVHGFAFIPGYKQHKFEDQDPINIQAVEIMGKLHDTLEAGGYEGHDLERFLVRILFCLFAEDTGIFEREAFSLYIENRTKEDGSDLGAHLARLFEILDTPNDRRQKTLEETLAGFPYVNGELFGEKLAFADFNRDMRNALLASTRFDWSQISPAIFGSLFQSIMEPQSRRQVGAHYTSERDILKLIRALFMDELREEFEKAKGKADLTRLHEKLAGLKFLDPACGCGNFLVISYRELRALEIEILKRLYKDQLKKGELGLSIDGLSQIDVDAFYGIEIGEWPARIAEVAMWLMDHQMNQQLSEAFGLYFARLPLKKSPHIKCANALRLDWNEVLPASKCSYVLGNPPFVGKKARGKVQQEDMEMVFGNNNGEGVLDYVCCWYLQAAKYIKSTFIRVAFVSTNSITQGEQPGILWNTLFRGQNIKIHFGHRTFSWESEARGKAHVHVVIIGFGEFDPQKKIIYEYDNEKVTAIAVKNISPYLIEGRDFALLNREKPLSEIPELQFGSMPNDNGEFLLTDEEKRELIQNEPGIRTYIRPLLSSKEYLHGINRWCLWLENTPPKKLTNRPK